MHRLKTVFASLLAVLALTTAKLTAASVQVPVVQGAWTLIGVPGLHETGGTSAAWDTGIHVLTDTVETEGNVTWDTTNTSGAAAENTASPGTFGAADFASVGLLGISSVTSGISSSVSLNYNYTTFNSVLLGTSYTSPLRSMYVKSPNASAPDVLVIYRAILEGETALIAYDSTPANGATSDIYQITFNYTNTYDDPQTAATPTSTSGTAYSSISAVFDMNISDNLETNLTNWVSSGYDQGYEVADSRELNGTLTVYTWDSSNMEWNFYKTKKNTDTANVYNNDDASDFTTFTPGKGYWVLFEKESGEERNYHADGSSAGFIMGSGTTGSISGGGFSYASLISEGWNLLSFEDEHIRYATTGLELNITGAMNSSLGSSTFNDFVTSGWEVNITDSYNARQLDFSFGVDELNSTHVICAHINSAVEGNNTKNSTYDFNLRCLPMDSVEEGDNNGSIVLISDRKFQFDSNVTLRTDTGSALIRTLAGDAPAQLDTLDDNKSYETRFGEYVLAFQPNSSFLELNTSSGGSYKDMIMSVSIPELNATAKDVNLTSGGQDWASIFKNLEGNITDIGSGVTTQVMAIDTGWNESNATILVAVKDYRFYLRDKTFTRFFQVSTLNSSALALVGRTGISHSEADFNNTTVSVTANDAETTASDINATWTSTSLQAVAISADQIMVWSGAAKDFEVLEQGYGEGLTPVYSPDTNTTTKGTVGAVYSARNILGGSVTDDGNYSTLAGPLTSDLKYNAIWAEDFPASGPLYNIVNAGFRPELFVVGATELLDADGDGTYGEYIGWRQIDITRPPAGVDSTGSFDPNSGWYNPYDKFDLFHTEKERGYWVYATANPSNTISVTASGGSNGFSGKVTRHFQNDINDTTGGTGVVYNHPDKTATVTVSGLYTYYSNLGYTQPNYLANVTATIAGQSIPMFPTGSSDQFTMELSKYEVLNPSQFAEGSDYSMVVSVSDGLGFSASGSTTYDYSPPSTPTVSWNGTSIEANSTNAAYIKVFEGNVSDYQVWRAVTEGASMGTGTTGYNLLTTGTGDSLSYNVNSSSLLSHPNDQASTPRSYYYDIRVIGVDGSDNTNSLWSDMQRTYYSPALLSASSSRAVHVLSASGSTATSYDKNPTKFTTAGVNDGNYTDSDGNAIDSGVQVKAATTNTTVTIAYQHREIQLEEALVYGMNVGNASGIFGTVLFMPQYAGETFYIYYNDGTTGTVYYGTFPSDNSYLDETSYYKLSTSSATSGPMPSVTGQTGMAITKY